MKRAVLLLLAGCADPTITVAPVVDGPTNASAEPAPLDTIVLEVAHAGAATDLVSETFTTGEAVAIDDVPFGDDLVVHITGSFETSEVAYGRTCEFAVAPAGDGEPTPHVFFSRSVKFADTSLVPSPRAGGVAIDDVTGAGLALGGTDPVTGSANTAIERFDPMTGTLAVIGATHPRTGAVAAMLGTGAVAVVGGIDDTGNDASFIEVIDPSQPGNVVDELDDAVTARTQLTATALTGGDIVVIGGLAGSAASGAVDDIAIANDSISAIALRTQLAIPRYGHTATRLGNDEGAPVLVAGGFDGSGVPVDSAELYKPLSEDFSPTFAAKLVVPRALHQAVRMPDNSVLVIGGVDGNGNTVDTLELFTLDGGFTAVGTLPATAGLVGFAATTLPDGRVLLTGGSRTVGGPPLQTAFIASLDSIDGSVDIVATDDLSTPRANHQATLLCDGTVLVTGGTAEPGAIAERYNPPATGRR